MEVGTERCGPPLRGRLLAHPPCAGGEQRRHGHGGARRRSRCRTAVWDATQKPVMQELATEFTRTHPNVDVNVQLTPWVDYWTKLKAAVERRRGARRLLDERPQLPAVRLQRRDQADRGAGRTPRSSPSPWWTSTPTSGKQYGLPKDMDTVGVWYNKTLFDAAKVKYPADDWTWADFQEAAAKLTDPDKGVLRHRGAARRVPGVPVQHHLPGRRLRDLPGRQEVRLRRPQDDRGPEVLDRPDQPPSSRPTSRP